MFRVWRQKFSLKIVKFVSTQKYKTKTKNRHLYFLLTWKSTPPLTTLNSKHLSDSQTIIEKCHLCEQKCAYIWTKFFLDCLLPSLRKGAAICWLYNHFSRGKAIYNYVSLPDQKLQPTGFVGVTAVTPGNLEKTNGQKCSLSQVTCRILLQANYRQWGTNIIEKNILENSKILVKITLWLWTNLNIELS